MRLLHCIIVYDIIDDFIPLFRVGLTGKQQQQQLHTLKDDHIRCLKKQVPRGYIRCDYFIVTYFTIVFDVV